jgi:hypothetical protein
MKATAKHILPLFIATVIAVATVSDSKSINVMAISASAEDATSSSMRLNNKIGGR